ncbi:hypothetical protein [Glycomyces buryatensis]|uniref:Copper chaperone PCu(A)C n=1 Tax=Glycomyces buryatensis TaxID=2570927 RepID=A0A4S8PQY0_9ACTN|nr:hypothetical protein [Glycomyces buryatensis]THV33600.1 hypothetical protein FAB82_26035 [Glycomyces buryatensis]
MLKNSRTSVGFGLAGLVLVASGLTACSAGQVTQTADTQPAVSGINADAGDVSLRDVQIVFGASGAYEEGDDVPLHLWIGNEGKESIVLESVTSPAAESVSLATGPLEIETEPEESPSEEHTDEAEESPGEEATDEASPSESPSEETPEPEGPEDETPEDEATEDESDETAGSGEFEIEIAPGGFVRLFPAQGDHLVLEGLSKSLNMSESVEVVFAFSNGDEATLRVPVGTPPEPLPREYLEEGEGGH